VGHRHSLIRRLRWEPYDPTWLVGLARAQEPEEPWLVEALARCTRGAWECEAYLYFIDPKGRLATFDGNIVLESATEGDLVLDVLADRTVAGVEFLSRL
jgi:hypothetical protein